MARRIIRDERETRVYRVTNSSSMQAWQPSYGKKWNRKRAGKQRPSVVMVRCESAPPREMVAACRLSSSPSGGLSTAPKKRKKETEREFSFFFIRPRRENNKHTIQVHNKLAAALLPFLILLPRIRDAEKN